MLPAILPTEHVIYIEAAPLLFTEQSIVINPFDVLFF